MQSFLYMEGKVFPWFALRCSPPLLAGAHTPNHLKVAMYT
ncbi:hypothetical protein BGX16_0617 [Hallerella succinigenes]|uniref:Uncharacterized protein n=1 Tax=Hallerella succinigenes TaxID=1896222 RepID=A0A2M9A4N7_9BACT|nr:hypothetical protein BGX16_0617 [Hallerella succinigenes]